MSVLAARVHPAGAAEGTHTPPVTQGTVPGAGLAAPRAATHEWLLHAVIGMPTMTAADCPMISKREGTAGVIPIDIWEVDGPRSCDTPVTMTTVCIASTPITARTRRVQTRGLVLHRGRPRSASGAAVLLAFATPSPHTPRQRNQRDQPMALRDGDSDVSGHAVGVVVRKVAQQLVSSGLEPDGEPAHGSGLDPCARPRATRRRCLTHTAGL